MAKKKQKAAEPKQKQNSSPRRDTEQKRPYTLADCMKIGIAANILFVVFIIVCLIYYYSLAKRGNYVIPFEVVAYTIEMLAFVLFTLSAVWIDRLVRARGIMKIALIVYIVVEVILMLQEFQFIHLPFYDGRSAPVIIAHVIFSGLVSFSLLLLDPQNKRVQIVVSVTTCVIFAGMLIALTGYRVYLTILLNAFAYIFFFTATLRLIDLEEIDVDCYGDQAKVQSFDSTMFSDTPTLIEAPMREKETIGRKLRRTAAKFSLENEEKLVLTDKDEKFEYEFGVDDDDDDENGGEDA